MLKKVLKWMGIAVTTPILLILLLAALLYLPPFQNWAAHKVAAIASEKTGMTISVERIRLEWPLDLGIDHFRCLHEGDTIANVGHLVADIRLCPLWDKRVVIDELSMEKATLNTNGFISNLRIKGHVGQLWLHSKGIDLDSQQMEVNSTRLEDTHLDIALSDTAQQDTTETKTKWRIKADSIAIYRSQVALHLPGDTLNVEAYMGHFVARETLMDLGTKTYSIGNISLEDSRINYHDKSQPTATGLDYHHLCISHLALSADSAYHGPQGTRLVLRHTALREKSGLRIKELSAVVQLDTAFTHIEIPHLTLRTPDSDIEGEVHTDFTITAPENPGRMKVRLNAQIGKQDIIRFSGTTSQRLIRRYPNHPLSVKGSINGNLKRMEFTGLDIALPTAFHIKANGYATDVTDIGRMRGQMRLQATTRNLDFIETMIPVKGLNIPHEMTLQGNFKAENRRYMADFVFREGNGTVKMKAQANAAPRNNGRFSIASYAIDATIRQLDISHFLPHDSIGLLSATISAGGRGTDFLSARSSLHAKAQIQQLQYGHWDLNDLHAEGNLANGRAKALLEGHNSLFDGTIAADALLSSKRVEASLTTHLAKADLQRLHLSDTPLSVGMTGTLQMSSNLSNSHEMSGHLNQLSINDGRKAYHPEGLKMRVRTNKDTTLARVQSGDFIMTLDAAEGYKRLLSKANILRDSIIAQYKRKSIDQQAIKRLLPTLTLHAASGRNNSIADVLRSRDIDFRELLADISTSATTGINGKLHLYSLNYDSTRIDTVKLELTQRGDRLTYQGQVKNNRRNPQFVFNALFDGYIHEHGALIGLRYYDGGNRLGVRLGATASMADEGIRIRLMPERPTIGYKQFNLNADNYLLIDHNNRLQAKVDLIADDGTGLKLYTEEQDSTMLQDLTLSVNQLDLGEVTSVIPYWPHITGKLNGDYHIVMNQQKQISMVSDMRVSNMAYEGALIGNLGTELVYMQREQEGHAVEARLMIDDKVFGMLDGTYYSKNKAIDATFTMNHFPLSIANGYVPDQLIGLDGYGEGRLTIRGHTDRPVVNGEIYLDSAYLVSHPYGIRMRFDNDPVLIEDSRLLLENFGLYAYNDQPLNLMGAINFSDPAHITMDMRMRAQNLQLINARQNARSVAFGKAFVNFFARMNGPIEALTMRGRLDVLGTTDMTYMLLDSPLSTDNRLDELVQFTDFQDTTYTVTAKRPKPSGLDADLTISVSQGAHIVCGLNAEQTNYIDLMGGGDLRMHYGGQQGLTLGGRYTLSNGEMKYSLPVIPLKTFNIQNGSYVEFTGDPMNPRLNITATERTKATVGAKEGQSRSVAFDCGVVITKTLADMGLQFIIAAPEDMEVNGELQSMSVEERGKLAVTMLTTGMYLADGNTNGFSMNSALSSFLQGEINNITGSALKTLDLQLGLDNTTDASGAMHTDYSFKFSKRLFDNRLKIQLGGKVSTGAEVAGQQQSFFDNVTMEYRLNQDATKNLKVFYQQNVYDWLEGYTGLYGVGFVWRRKMDSLLDIFRRDKKVILPNDSIQLKE